MVPLLALLLAALIAGCGGGGGEPDLSAYERALAALRSAEGDGQLHAARVTGDEITFDLVKEGPAVRVRWSGSELESTGDDVGTGAYFDISQLSADGARSLMRAAVERAGGGQVREFWFSPGEELRAIATVVVTGADPDPITLVGTPDGSRLEIVRPVG